MISPAALARLMAGSSAPVEDLGEDDNMDAEENSLILGHRHREEPELGSNKKRCALGARQDLGSPVRSLGRSLSMPSWTFQTMGTRSPSLL